MRTFNDTEQEKLREAFETLVMDMGPAPDLEDLVDRPVRARVAAPQHRRGLTVAAVVVVPLLAIGLTALLASNQSDVAADPLDRGDVLVFFAYGTPFDTLVEVSNYLLTWEGVAVASPWTSQDGAAEFAEVFADQPELLAVVQEDPSVLPASVRVWAEPGADLSVIGQRVREEFPDALGVHVKGEEPQAIDVAPESTLPPPEVLVRQVDPIYGYGDYSGYSYVEVPWRVVTAAEIACMQDQGWPVKPDGDRGISWKDVSAEDNRASQIDFARCLAGLNLPEYAAPGG